MTVVEQDRGDENHEPLAENRARLEGPEVLAPGIGRRRAPAVPVGLRELRDGRRQVIA